MLGAKSPLSKTSRSGAPHFKVNKSNTQFFFNRDHPKVMGEEKRPRRAAVNKAMVAFVCYSSGRLGQLRAICIKVDDNGAMRDDSDTRPSERIRQTAQTNDSSLGSSTLPGLSTSLFSNSTMNDRHLVAPENSGSIFSTANIKSDFLSQPATSPFRPTPTNRAHEPVAPSSSSSLFPLFSRFPSSHTQQEWWSDRRRPENFPTTSKFINEQSKIRMAKVLTTAGS